IDCLEDVEVITIKQRCTQPFAHHFDAVNDQNVLQGSVESSGRRGRWLTGKPMSGTRQRQTRVFQVHAMSSFCRVGVRAVEGTRYRCMEN
ncbi:MAG: hypothetical protein AAF933_16230, partial [Pseudomonadota bacterium]